MKTLAVIKNELFQDYVKIVSTDNLQETLDSPEVPIPYTCMDAVDNSNAEALVGQLSSYFSQAKLGNKDFFRLNDDQNSQLAFMLNLIKISTGESVQTVKPQEFSIDIPVAQPVTPSIPEPPMMISSGVTPATADIHAAHNEEIDKFLLQGQDSNEALPEVATNPAPVETTEAPVVKVPNEVTLAAMVEADEMVAARVTETVVQPTEETNAEIMAAVSAEAPPVVEELPVVVDEDLDDPFRVDVKPYVPEAVAAPQEETPPVAEETVSEAPVAAAPEPTSSEGEMVSEFNIPKSATLHFFKNDTVTATLVDDKTVNFEGEVLTFSNAAKLAFKKAGAFGMANGLNNWLYEGKSLSQHKVQ